jgi:hypothetical protein
MCLTLSILLVSLVTSETCTAGRGANRQADADTRVTAPIGTTRDVE